MQWIIQNFNDTHKITNVLDKLGISYSEHKAIPFVGFPIPEPKIINPNNVMIYGAYSLRNYAEAKNLKPGVFVLSPFSQEEVWKPYILNEDVLEIEVKNVLNELPKGYWFVRPLEDTKSIAGGVKSYEEISAIVNGANSLEVAETYSGILSENTVLCFSKPKNVYREWRTWVVDNEIVTYSLYKEGSRVITKNEIDADALEFAKARVKENPCYSRAYVLDVCRSDDGLKIVETNCLNASGLYDADVHKLVFALEGAFNENS